MKRFRIAGILLLGGILSVALPAAGAAQIDEAQMAEAMDRLGSLLGLGPVAPEELKLRVEELGGLEFESDVPVDFMSREELSRYIRELFDDEYPREMAEREERMLRGFGLLGEEEDLRTLRERVLNENVAGFYDERPGVKKLFAISSGRSLNVMNQMILSHELRHALQDQHVVIRDQLEVESDYDDRRLAALCLFEGDASILMEQYLTSGAAASNPQLAGLFEVFSQSLTGEDVAAMFAGPALQEAPPVVQEQLVVPYFEGRRLAAAIFAKGGFELLNEMLADPPRSMEQVLHPEKYLSGDDEPVPVTLAEARWESVDFEGRLGELFVRVLLRSAVSREVADAAAAGWGGDHYAVLDEGGSYRLLWKSVWDTEADARELEAALRTYASERFPEEPVSVSRDGATVLWERASFR